MDNESVIGRRILVPFYSFKRPSPIARGVTPHRCDYIQTPTIYRQTDDHVILFHVPKTRQPKGTSSGRGGQFASNPRPNEQQTANPLLLGGDANYTELAQSLAANLAEAQERYTATRKRYDDADKNAPNIDRIWQENEDARWLYWTISDFMTKDFEPKFIAADMLARRVSRKAAARKFADIFRQYGLN